MRNLRKLIEAYGLRMEIVIESLPEPYRTETMEDLALTAERRGFVDSVTTVRMTNPWEFTMDVWTENPTVPDRLSLYVKTLPKPLQITEFAQLYELFQ